MVVFVSLITNRSGVILAIDSVIAAIFAGPPMPLALIWKMERVCVGSRASAPRVSREIARVVKRAENKKEK